MKDLEKTFGGFIFVNLFPSLQYSIFPLPPGPFDSFLILGKQKEIFQKNRVSQKFGVPFFGNLPRSLANSFATYHWQATHRDWICTNACSRIYTFTIYQPFLELKIFGCIHQPTSGNCSNCFTHPTLSPMLHANRFLRKHRVSDLGGCGIKSDLKPCWSTAGLRRFHDDSHSHQCHNQHDHTITTTTTITRPSQPQWKHPCTSSLGQVRTWIFLAVHFWNYVDHFSLGKQRRVWIAHFRNYDIKHVGEFMHFCTIDVILGLGLGSGCNDVVMWCKTCCDLTPEIGLGLGWSCNDVAMWCKIYCDCTPGLRLGLGWGCNDVLMWCGTCCDLTSQMVLGLGWGCNDAVMWCKTCCDCTHVRGGAAMTLWCDVAHVVMLRQSWGWAWGGAAMTVWCDVAHAVMLRKWWGGAWGGVAMTLWCDVGHVVIVRQRWGWVWGGVVWR